MRRVIGLTSVFLSIFVLLLAIPAATEAWNTGEEIRRLNKEVPAIEGFGGASSVVWLKNNDFGCLTTGRWRVHTIMWCLRENIYPNR